MHPRNSDHSWGQGGLLGETAGFAATLDSDVTDWDTVLAGLWLLRDTIQPKQLGVQTFVWAAHSLTTLPLNAASVVFCSRQLR